MKNGADQRLRPPRGLGNLLLIALIFGVLSGCTARVEKHLESVDQNTERLADELENDRKYLQGVSESLSELEKQSLVLARSTQALEKSTQTVAESFIQFLVIMNGLGENVGKVTELAERGFSLFEEFEQRLNQDEEEQVTEEDLLDDDEFSDFEEDEDAE